MVLIVGLEQIDTAGSTVESFQKTDLKVFHSSLYILTERLSPFRDLSELVHLGLPSVRSLASRNRIPTRPSV